MPFARGLPGADKMLQCLQRHVFEIEIAHSMSVQKPVQCFHSWLSFEESRSAVGTQPETGMPREERHREEMSVYLGSFRKATHKLELKPSLARSDKLLARSLSNVFLAAVGAARACRHQEADQQFVGTA